jgi:endoglucanase
MKSFLASLIALVYLNALVTETEIRINQSGYYPSGPKIAIIVNAEDHSHFELVSPLGEVVFKGKLGKNRTWKKSGESVRKADFTIFQKRGKYQIKVGEKLSHPFEIKEDAWRGEAVGLMKSYYLQRCTFELDEPYAGIYKRPLGHPDTACVFHPSSTRTGKLNAPGGWYDAGDFGKYIVSAGVTLGNMLSLYEMYPEVFPDNSTNIPESGNGLSDMLDEAKYELDWFKFMQDEDGGVFVKITSAKYPPMMLPHKDPLQRNVYGKSTASTLHFAACMAMAGRIYQNHFPEWSEDCLKRAEKAWLWASKNDDDIFQNPEGVLSGDYSNSQMSDEFLWAAAELYISTQESKYEAYLLRHSEELDNMAPSGWANVNALAICSLSLNRQVISTELAGKVRESLLIWSDERIKEIEKSAYHLPEFQLVWGSNGFIGSTGLCFVYAYETSEDQKYLNAASHVADYILGKNATGYCFVTGYGTQRVVNLHHSVSIADGIDGCLPGFVPGGPNPSMEDAQASEHGEAVVYESALPARAYVDSQLSYASNENDICYSAPVLALIASLDYLLGEEYPQDWKEYYAFPE